MYKLLAVTIAALYFGMLHFGDANRRQVEVARAEPMALELAPASFEFSEPEYVSPISDAEAVKLAIAAHKTHREDRGTAPADERVASSGTVSSDASPVAAPNTGEASYWVVTGTRVNLRGGPGTGNAVVGQVVLGDEAEVLDTANGWYQIRLADGSVSGWIFGKFLNEQRPG